MVVPYKKGKMIAFVSMFILLLASVNGQCNLEMDVDGHISLSTCQAYVDEYGKLKLQDKSSSPPVSPSPSQPSFWTHNLTFVNKCPMDIWMGSYTQTGKPLTPSGMKMIPGSSISMQTHSGWAGRIWGRTGCDTSGRNCDTGDCGSMDCNGGKSVGERPTTLAEFNFRGFDNLDFYDISLVDGYNIPITISLPPNTYKHRRPGKYDCGVPTCTFNTNALCPSELKLYNQQNKVVACKSACQHFNKHEYCCDGPTHNSPETCPPFHYANIFKQACPDAYSYAYDDYTSTYTCEGTNYIVQFC